jgi:hypothetical protein
MGAITQSWRWIRSIGRRRSLEGGFDEEVRFHVASYLPARRGMLMAPIDACERTSRVIEAQGLYRSTVANFRNVTVQRIAAK